MSSNKKRFSLGWVLGISLGLACSAGAVYAGSISQTYSTTTPVDVTLMTNVKTAVNDNDTRITNLQGNAGSGTCVTNNASDVMVRVGPLCVDKHRASIFTSTATGGSAITTMPSTCNADGTDNAGVCNIVAQSRNATPIDGTNITWAQAQRACTNAGKRLLTPGEWMAAYSSGLTADMATPDKEDYVDAAVTGAGAKMLAGYMGPTTGASGVEFTANLDYDAAAGVANIFGFRCAR